MRRLNAFGGALVLLLAGSHSLGAWSANLITGGDFSAPDFVEPGQTTYYRTPYQDTENGVRSWQFDLEYDLGRWVGQWDISHHANPRDPSVWPALHGDALRELKSANRSQDAQANYFLEIPRFYSWVIDIVQPPGSHVAGPLRFECDYYFQPWEAEPANPERNWISMSVWGINAADLPQPDPTRGDTIWFGPSAEIGTNLWALTYTADPSSPNYSSGSGGWAHIQSPDITVATAYDYYKVLLLGSAYGEELWYDLVGKPADSLTVAWDNVELLVNVLLADVNRDGARNALDISGFIQRVTSGNYQTEADCNQDGAVNALDIAKFIYYVTGGTGEAAVPEPGTAGVVVLGALAVVKRRR